MLFLTRNQETITKFSSQVSDYIQHKFRLKRDRPQTRGSVSPPALVALEPLLVVRECTQGLKLKVELELEMPG